MIGKFLLAACLPALAVAASTSLQFVSPPDGQASAHGVLPLAAGSVAVYGAQILARCYSASPVPGTCDQVQAPLLAIIGATGAQTWPYGFSLGSGNSSIAASAADSNGNIWITGETDSDDFPLVNALLTKKTLYRATGFVAKLSSNLDILFSTFLGGQTIPDYAQTAPAAIALDGAGNPVIVGATNDRTFPTTGPVFGAIAASTGPSLPLPYEGYAFIVKLAADGSKLLYGRLLSGAVFPCTGSGCSRGPLTAASAVAVDASGEATVAGQTNAIDFPITAKTYNTAGGAFVSRISSDGSALIWSTEIGAAFSVPNVSAMPSTIQAIAIDSTGSVYLGGTSLTPISTPPNALQTTYQPATGYGGGFAIKLSADASQLLFATNLGGLKGATLAGLALDRGGNVWVTGFTESSDFPGLNGVANIDFALELNADATAVQRISHSFRRHSRSRRPSIPTATCSCSAPRAIFSVSTPPRRIRPRPFSQLLTPRFPWPLGTLGFRAT